MAQRVFDVENEKDMADLWDILPDDIEKIEVEEANEYNRFCYKKVGACEHSISSLKLIAINWHDKREITRPIQEATDQDIGKICRFWNDTVYSDDVCFGILSDIREDESCGKVYLRNKEMWCGHARRLTKQEIEKLI